MSYSCGASFAVRFVRNGDYIRVFADINKEDGSGAALFQIVDANSGVAAPDWTKPENQPIIRLSALSTAEFPVEITDISWGFDGQNIVFGNLTEAWQDDKNKIGFQARMSGGCPELKIVKNIASADVSANRQINYELSYMSNGMSDKVQGSLDVLIQAAGESCYSVMITATDVILSETVPQTTLSVIANYGIGEVPIGKNGYTLEWYNGETKIPGTSGKSLVVNRDMVEGGSVFVAKLLKDGKVVAQNGQRINDIADEYQIDYVPRGTDFVGPKTDATFDLSVTRNKKPLGAGENVNYKWDIYNAIGAVTHSGTGPSVTVTAEYCKVAATKEKPVSYYNGVDVHVTANII